MVTDKTEGVSSCDYVNGDAHAVLLIQAAAAEITILGKFHEHGIAFSHSIADHSFGMHRCIIIAHMRTQLFLIQCEHTYTQGLSCLQLLLLKRTHVIIRAFLLKVIGDVITMRFVTVIITL